MDKPKIKPGKGPETIIRDALVDFLRLRGWFVKIIHGSTFTTGMPDLYIAKRSYGTRWVEVKNPEAYSFTPAQIETFPCLAAQGVGIWILTAATESEYQKLFKPANWWTYLYIPNMNKD